MPGVDREVIVPYVIAEPPIALSSFTTLPRWVREALDISYPTIGGVPCFCATTVRVAVVSLTSEIDEEHLMGFILGKGGAPYYFEIPVMFNLSSEAEDRDIGVLGGIGVLQHLIINMEENGRVTVRPRE